MQRVDGVNIRRWPAVDPLPTPADVVDRGVRLRPARRYVAAMAGAGAPVWFVLEYLCAEPWVDGAHGLPSPHPRLR